jgi:hypothetical protein
VNIPYGKSIVLTGATVTAPSNIFWTLQIVVVNQYGTQVASFGVQQGAGSQTLNLTSTPLTDTGDTVSLRGTLSLFYDSGRSQSAGSPVVQTLANIGTVQAPVTTTAPTQTTSTACQQAQSYLQYLIANKQAIINQYIASGFSETAANDIYNDSILPQQQQYVASVCGSGASTNTGTQSTSSTQSGSGTQSTSSTQSGSGTQSTSGTQSSSTSSTTVNIPGGTGSTPCQQAQSYLQHLIANRQAIINQYIASGVSEATAVAVYNNIILEQQQYIARICG